MQIVDELTGDFIIRQGDDGQYVVEDIPNDKNYTAYFSVSDSKGNFINEVIEQTNNETFVKFTFTPSVTDEWTVKKGEEQAIYYFAVKLCYGIDQIEDTLVIGNKSIYDKNVITVLAKQSEGGI